MVNAAGYQYAAIRQQRCRMIGACGGGVGHNGRRERYRIKNFCLADNSALIVAANY
jgi:hypothetical protein